MKKTPSKTKSRQGTTEPARVKVIKIEAATPEPQDYLSKRGKEIFKIISGFCVKNNIATVIDTFSLSRLSNAIDLHAQLADTINGGDAVENMISVYENGSNVSGYFTAMNRLSSEIDSLGKKYGLDQESREKLLAFLNKKPDLPGKLKGLIK